MIRRTALITTASVAGVIVAGAAVVGANVAILDSTVDEGVGSLSATTVPVAEQVAVPVPDESQTYAVDVAGTVVVERTGGELGLGEVTESLGWTHVVSQQSPGALVLTFTSDSTTYQFLATIGPDGNISAGVSQPIDETVVTPGSSSASQPSAGQPTAPQQVTPPPPAPRYESDDDRDDHDDHDDSHEESEHEEHEGGDDDD